MVMAHDFEMAVVNKENYLRQIEFDIANLTLTLIKTERLLWQVYSKCDAQLSTLMHKAVV